MRITNSIFIFRDKDHQQIRVAFAYDERGKATTCKVHIGDNKSHEVENLNGQFKPCVTHCRELIRLASGK